MLRTVLLAALVASCLGAVLEDNPLILDPRIVGGVPVDISQHPYQVSLQTVSHICGASIISNKWVVTAAHCTSLPVSRYVLKVGNNNNKLGTAYKLKNIIRHPNYNSRAVDFDIALLEIDGVISFNKNVQPINLANAEPSTGMTVDVTGWGALKEGGPASSQLMKVSIPIVSRSQCQEIYKKLNPITERMICAGYIAGGKDACQGDSGGPLAAHGNLYGIVSWGKGCAKPQYPGVYTNVANLRSWIRSTSGV